MLGVLWTGKLIVFNGECHVVESIPAVHRFSRDLLQVNRQFHVSWLYVEGSGEIVIKSVDFGKRNRKMGK